MHIQQQGSYSWVYVQLPICLMFCGMEWDGTAAPLEDSWNIRGEECREVLECTSLWTAGGDKHECVQPEVESETAACLFAPTAALSPGACFSCPDYSSAFCH